MPFDVVTYMYALKRGITKTGIDTIKYIGNNAVNDLVKIISTIDASISASFMNNITPDLVRKLFSSGLPNALDIINSWLTNSSINSDAIAAAIDGFDVSASDVATLLNTKLSSGAVTVDAMARILASSQLSVSKLYSILVNMDADNVQKILYNWVSELLLDRLIDLITHNAPSVTLNANTTFTGVNRFYNLYLNSYTYTADGQPHVIIAQSIDVPSLSSIVKTPTGGAGGSVVAPGGRGGGGLIILAKSMTVAGTISANGQRGSDYVGGGRGAGGNNGAMPTVFNLSPGNGSDTCSYGYGLNVGGKPGAGAGGGYDWNIYDAGGPGGSVTLTNYSTINDLVNALVFPVVDWYIVNVLGKTPTTTSAFPACYGAGGGGGGSCGGGGGGSGGFIFIYSPLLSLTGTLSANGGDGGNADTSADSSCYNGGAGGGGLIFAITRMYVPPSKISVNGGILGAPQCGSVSTPGSFATMWL